MQLDDNTFIVNSLPSLAAFWKLINEVFSQHKYVTFSWRIGADRSLDQNALFHVWLTEYCAHLAGITKKQVQKGMVEHLKRKVKKQYYGETGYSWMLAELIDPQTGEKTGVHYASSSDYKTGEMFLFLTWLQMTAANDGIVLESKGQFNKLQREQQAA